MNHIPTICAVQCTYIKLTKCFISLIMPHGKGDNTNSILKYENYF